MNCIAIWVVEELLFVLVNFIICILNGRNTTLLVIIAMKFDAANAVLITACIAGSLIQCKLLLSLFSTPLLATWIFSIFLVIIGALRWLIGSQDKEGRESASTQPSLYAIILPMADVVLFFITLNYSSLLLVALSQLLVLSFWQLIYSTETTTDYKRAKILFGVGFVLHLIEIFQTKQFSWVPTWTAMLHTYVNYYLHHYAQRYVKPTLYLKSEIFAGCTLATILVPFAWLELNTIDFSDIEVSSSIVPLALTCILYYCYRHCGPFLNTLTQLDRTKLFLMVTLIIILLSKDTITSLMVASLGAVCAAAYLSTGSGQSQHYESKAHFSILVALCTIVLLAQGVVVVVNQSDQFIGNFDVTPVPHLKPIRGLQPITLNKVFESNRLVCLHKVRERIVSEMSSHIKHGQPIAFMDLPLHWNLGDVLIGQGTQHVLEIYGQFPIVTDQYKERNISVAKTLIEDGVVFLQGGGNFGDMWRESSDVRLKVVEQIKDNDIVFLPQSIYYRADKMVSTHNATFQTNKRLTFMLRDHTSLAFSRKKFPGIPAKYVPDMAFVLGPQTPSANPVVDIIFLLRLDKETATRSTDKTRAEQWLKNMTKVTYEMWDFPVLGFPIPSKNYNLTEAYNYTEVYPKQWTSLPPNNRHATFGIRTQMANNLFSRGRMVITDRLHASVMATLMGKPVIYLDNNYKKITNVRGSLAKEFEECSDEYLHARHTDTLMEAVKLAKKILSGEERI